MSVFALAMDGRALCVERGKVMTQTLCEYCHHHRNWHKDKCEYPTGGCECPCKGFKDVDTVWRLAERLQKFLVARRGRD